MTRYHTKQFPNESDDYRQARMAVLAAELELDAKIQELAAARRALPLGGEVPQDYVFEELRDQQVSQVPMSTLFADGKGTLFIYSFMYGPKQEKPCPACTSLIDGLNGCAPHIQDRMNMVVVAKSPIERVRKWGDSRNWNRVRLLSSARNSYNQDYFGETPEGTQIPAINIFQAVDGKVFHFYSTEMLFVQRKGDPRHADLLWPLWNLLDMTPKGRGEKWYPKLSY